MNKALVITLGLLFCVMGGIAQEVPKPEKASGQVADSLRTDLREEGVRVIDSVKTTKKEINPLAPSKAAFYSAVIPGLGQVYNKRYWKVPIVYAALGASIYGYTYNDDLYDRFRSAFKRRQAGFTDDEFYDLRPDDGITPSTPDLDLNDLENQQERYQRDRDLMLLITIAVYALNIVDANVDAHLKQFNVNDDLSLEMDFKPYLDVNPITNNPNYGMAMVIKIN